jgi:hypothetical protein
MGNARFRTLSDFGKHHANIGAVCGGCGHEGVVHRDPFARWCFLFRKNTALELLPTYLRCSQCGSRPRHITPSFKPPTFPRWGTDEQAWKRLHRRLRG